MVKPVFSEFSFGFAITHELVDRFGAPVGSAPVFPSLVSEDEPAATTSCPPGTDAAPWGVRRSAYPRP